MVTTRMIQPASMAREKPSRIQAAQEAPEACIVDLRTPSASPEPPRNRSSIIKRSIAERPVVVYSSSPNKYRNQDVEQQAAKLQAEFEALMNNRDKPKNEFWNQEADRDGFYSMMTDFYKFERHDSPTTRLRHQKDSTCESKDILSRSMPQNGGDYKLTYITKPGRADVMEPGRELNYNLAYKDPVKFIDQVLAKETQQTTLKDRKGGFENKEER